MTRLRRTALFIAITAAASLLAVDAASEAEAAKLKKHKPVPTDAAAAETPAASGSASTAPTAQDPKTGAGAAEAGKIPPSFPKTVDEAKAEAEAATKPPQKWSDAEIADAKAHCAVVLGRIHAVAIPHEPIKEGACGAPAPVELVSIGQNPQVAISPPAIVRCDLAEALSTWLKNDLQPLARKNLGSPIIKIETMSSYSCRNAYGRKKTKLSEHGLANAVDIRGFVTASAKTAYVLEDWGTPQREIVARIAAEKAAAEKQAAEIAAADKAAQTNLASDKSAIAVNPAPPTATSIGGPAAGIARSTIIDGVPKLTVTLPGATPPDAATTLSVAEPARLGGPLPRADQMIDPKSSATTLVAARPIDAPERDGPQREFLHQAHDTACKIFGTTLGPEANEAHRNHLHVDMAERSVPVKICD